MSVQKGVLADSKRGQKQGTLRSKHCGLPLRRNLTPRTYAGFLNL
nr:MAG TPA: hypothetical protein [Caudoviricetes sp.]